MSRPCSMRSDALHVLIVVILMFPAPEYPIARTLWVDGTPFLSSMSLILALVSRPLGLSLAVIGGLTRMMRHFGSAVGSACVFGAGLSCFLQLWGGACLGVTGFAAIAAHDDWFDPFIGVAVVDGSWFSVGCGCVKLVACSVVFVLGCVLEGIRPKLSSSSLMRLVRYALVSAR